MTGSPGCGGDTRESQGEDRHVHGLRVCGNQQNLHEVTSQGSALYCQILYPSIGARRTDRHCALLQAVYSLKIRSRMIARRNLVAIAVLSSAVMEVLDTSVVNVSLPHIAGSLSAATDEEILGPLAVGGRPERLGRPRLRQHERHPRVRRTANCRTGPAADCLGCVNHHALGCAYPSGCGRVLVQHDLQHRRGCR